MKKSYLLYFIVAIVFSTAAIVGFIKGYGFRSVAASLLALSFVLAGIHYKRKEKIKIKGKNLKQTI
jgi:hypothetical protein